ncbi:MAG: S-layer homology domain-containing protein [Sedimentibacter sp.]
MKKLVILLLALLLIVFLAPIALADVTPPTSLEAPEHFGVGHYYHDSVYFTFSVPESLRNYIEKWKEDDPQNHRNFSLYYQFDYKVDGGNYKHTSDWDSKNTLPKGIKNLYLNFGHYNSYSASERWGISGLFPNDEDLKQFYNDGWDYLENHSITFRVRFAHSFDNNKTFILSPWSKEYTLAANVKADYNKLINNAPTLTSADLKFSSSGKPYLDVFTGRVPASIKDLNAMTSGSVRTEVWMRKDGDKDFKQIFYQWSNVELLNIDASNYFSVDNSQQSYNAEGYEIKIRYALDLRKYKQSSYTDSTTSQDIYSPFSNVISHNMPAWSNASSWATPELKKANDAGLIPQILNGADMTKPITREEFAELAVKLYEKTTERKASATSPNPFTDTINPEILKAFKIGVTQGTSATTFEPNVLINREQCATMLFRALKAMAPKGSFSIEGVKDFPDQKHISDWANEAVKYMNKIGIIAGDSNGNFMPKATTTALQAQSYGMATREQAIAMSYRSYERYKDSDEVIKGDYTPQPEPPKAEEPKIEEPKTEDPKIEEPKTEDPKIEEPKTEEPEMGNSIVGSWEYFAASGSVAFGSSLEFKSDGTFIRVVGTVINYTYDISACEGNYEISGDKLILTNQMMSKGYEKSWEELWKISDSVIKDIPVADQEYTIEIVSDDVLIINGTEFERML